MLPRFISRRFDSIRLDSTRLHARMVAIRYFNVGKRKKEKYNFSLVSASCSIRFCVTSVGMFEKLVPFFDHTFPYNSETLELYCFYFARYTKLRTKFVQNSWTKEVSSFRRFSSTTMPNRRIIDTRNTNSHLS